MAKGYRNWYCDCKKCLSHIVIDNCNVTRCLASGASEVMSKVSHWRSRPWEAVLYRRLHFLDPWLGPRGPQRSLRALNFYTLKPLQYGCLRTPLDPTKSPVPVPRHCGTFSVLNGTFRYFLYLFLARFTSCPTYEYAEILIFFLKFSFLLSFKFFLSNLLSCPWQCWPLWLTGTDTKSPEMCILSGTRTVNWGAVESGGGPVGPGGMS